MSPAPTRTGIWPACARLRTPAAVLIALVLAGCASTPPAGPAPAPSRLVAVSPAPPPAVRAPELSEIRFSALPGWSQTDARPALAAFVESCRRVEARRDDAPLAPGAPYAGRTGDWREPCLEASMLAGRADADAARAFFERQFTPMRLGARGRLTGYYEPYVEVREAPDREFSMAIRGRPGDLLTGDLGQFIAGLEGQRIMGRATDQRFEPYRPRAEIEALNLGVPLAWGRPIDVFFLQIQGSGRLVYRDGGQARVRFAAHNGLPYVSIGRILIDRGELPSHGASKQDIERWLLQRGPDAWTALFNENPRYVFFSLDVLNDPNEGPLGAQGAPLTPMASMAVDPAYHAWGAPVFVQAVLPGAPDWSGLVIAQDAGGAITGPARGDLFFGWGPEAGERAGRQNDPAAQWTILLPRALARRLTS